jgi:hypothetical protein
MLTPHQAHSLVWKRTVNNRGIPGSNISLDLRMEHIVHLLKEMISNLGVNLTPDASLRCSRAIWPEEQMLKAIVDKLGCHSRYGKHTVCHSEKDFELIVHEFIKKRSFNQNKIALNTTISRFQEKLNRQPGLCTIKQMDYWP